MVKKGFAILLIIALALPVFGCAGREVPSPDYEGSILWKSGFMPYGPVVVKAGFCAAIELVPELRIPLLVIGAEAKAALEAGELRKSLQYLVDLVNVRVDVPVVRMVMANAVDTLYAAMNLPESLMTPYDKAVIISMIDEILSYAAYPRNAAISS